MTAKFHNYLEGYKKLNYLMNKILLINIIRENNYRNYFITTVLRITECLFKMVKEFYHLNLNSQSS